MAVVVEVPLNTSLADLDEALRSLLRRELERHGFEGVDVAFDAPSTDWSSRLTNPTVNVFLYDLRENVAQADASPRDVRINGAAMTAPPPLRLEVTYSVSAWTKSVEDEHRLLSQVLAILFSHAALPPDLLAGRLADAGRRRAIETEVGRPKAEKSEFWTSIGGRYKASIDYAVRLELESGTLFTRGPDVRTQTVHVRRLGAPRQTMEELQRFGGTLSGPGGEPVGDAWVALPDLGRFTTTDADGRFAFSGVRPGEHRVVARTRDGAEAAGTASVPGSGVDLTLP